MKKLLIATTNKGKLRELSELLSDLPLQFVSLSDVGITDEPEENGNDYKENSRIKALYYSKESGLPAVADDGGLEIAALGGAPGLKSHRWLGPQTTEEDLISHMKKVAKELPDNNCKAFFKVVLSLGFPDGRVTSFSGKIEGVITREPFFKYEPGYPYRSFFFIPALNKYYFEDELTPDELMKYNHRYKAAQKLKELLKRELL
jgi:XTP/dITP diphosphohydrolase